MEDLVKAKAAIAPVQTAAQDAEIQIQNMPLTTPRDFESAGEYLTYISSTLKRLEADRTAITGPMNESLRAVNDLFRPVKSRLMDRKKALVARISEARKDQEDARLAAIATGDHDQIVANISAPASTMSEVSVVDYEITDLSRVPVEFLDVKRAALLVAIRSGREVPGVRKTESIRARAKAVRR